MANHKMANHHWFVSVETPKQSRRGIRLHVRQTKAFPIAIWMRIFAKNQLRRVKRNKPIWPLMPRVRSLRPGT